LKLLGTILSVLAFASGAMAEAGNEPAAGRAPASSLTREEAKMYCNLWVTQAKPNRLRAYTDVANTGSMLPLFDGNAVLLLEEVKPEELKRKNIALYESDGHLVAHFFEDRWKNIALFKGFNNNRPDWRINTDRIKWRVCVILYTEGK